MVFCDVRGDFSLLFTLFTQVMKIAQYENKKWSWTCRNTTVICLGNFVDRYEPVCLNRIGISTRNAIIEQKLILSAFIDLQQQSSDQNNQFVVLMGDHELGCLLRWPDYEICQMAFPENAVDQEMHTKFVEEELRPFCAQQGLIAGWGREGAQIYFCRGGLDYKWMSTSPWKFRSISDMNTKWRRWMEKKRERWLHSLKDPDSIIFSTKMSIWPQEWRNFDEEQVNVVLGSDPHPRFVQSRLPIQQLMKQTYGLRKPMCSKTVNSLITIGTHRISHFTMAASPDMTSTDQIYHIHNCMADVFCRYPEDDRQPQALEFSLYENGSQEALYLECKTLRLPDMDYILYANERLFGVQTCLAPMNHSVDFIPLTAVEQAVLPSKEGNNVNIRQLILLLFSADEKQILLLNEPCEIQRRKWNLPGTSFHQEDMEGALHGAVKRLTGFECEDLTLLKGTTVDYSENTRVWVRTAKGSAWIDPKKARWVDYDKVWSTEVVNSMTGTCLCFLSYAGIIPSSLASTSYCPGWMTRLPNS